MYEKSRRLSNHPVAIDGTERTTAIELLYVEDNSEFADLVVTCLNDEADQLTITTAPDAMTALEELSDEIDCIVSDYNMAVMNGVEFLETVRETYPDLPFILFTARGPDAIARGALESSSTDYLQKAGGIDQFTTLANRIRNAVEQHQT